MAAVGKSAPPVDVDPLDAIDCVEAMAEPVAADLARRGLLVGRPSALVRRSAKQTVMALRRRASWAASPPGMQRSQGNQAAPAEMTGKAVPNGLPRLEAAS